MRILAESAPDSFTIYSANVRILKRYGTSAIYSLGEIYMLLTIAAVLVILWFLGVVTSTTLGGFIHLLLVLAVVAILVRVIRGENPIA